MILYRLFWLRFLKYCELDESQEQGMMFFRKRKKKVHKTRLMIDEEMNHYISILMSIAAVLLFLSIPFVLLETPCEIFQENQYYILYDIATAIYDHFYIMDITIILTLILLAYVTLTAVLDAIDRTNLKISPWVERGKYKLPDKRMIVRKQTPEIDYTGLLYEKSRNLIVNGRYYEQCGGILREKRLEEYKNRIIDIPVTDRSEMSYHELVMFERQYDLYRNRVLSEQKIKENKH